MGAGRFSMIGTVIDGPPHEAVHLEYAEEVRAGETVHRREKIRPPSPTPWPHTLSLRGRQDSDYNVNTETSC